MASESTDGIAMSPRRSLYILLATIAVTLFAVLAHPLIPERQFSVIPHADSDMIFALYGDSMEGGPSHSEWVGPEENYHWRCRVEPEGDYVYCGMNIILSHDNLRGVDLTDFQAIELQLETVGHNKNVQFFMRHYDERYSNPDDNNSAQFNKIDIMGGELGGTQKIGFDELTLADWWSSSRKLPRELRRPAFHNVIAFGIGYSEALEPGNYDVVIKQARFVGPWVTAATWYLSILLLWLVGLGAWGVYQLVALSRIAKRHRRHLDILANRNESLKRETDRYKQLSIRDPLTGAYNRYGFEQRLAKMIHQDEYQPISLILLDVDHFKKFNDTYGHDAGDKVLRQLVNLLDQQTRKQDVLCRWGGEEFLLLCPNTDSHNAAVLAEKLRLMIAEARIEMNEKIRLTASFGVCQIRAGEPYIDAFIRTDRALFQAKDQGRNRVMLCPEAFAPLSE